MANDEQNRIGYRGPCLGLLSGAAAGGLWGLLVVSALLWTEVSWAEESAFWWLAIACTTLGGLAGGTIAASRTRARIAGNVPKRPLWLATLLGGLVGACAGGIFGWVPLGTQVAADDVLRLLLIVGACRGLAYGALGGLAGGAIGAAVGAEEYL